MDYQRWEGHCLNGGLIKGLQRVRLVSLPIGRININQVVVGVAHEVAVFFPKPRPQGEFVFQIAVRTSCEYGHYALALVDERNNVYLFDPDGRPAFLGSILRRIAQQEGFQYSGSLSKYLNVTMPRRHNHGRHECGLWVTYVYHLLATGKARKVLRLPLHGQRKMLERFVESIE
jgi:hypothetical protein